MNVHVPDMAHGPGNLPVKTESVKESAKSLHNDEDCDSEASPEGEGHHQSDRVHVFVDVHAQTGLHNHVPEYLTQLCWERGLELLMLEGRVSVVMQLLSHR